MIASFILLFNGGGGVPIFLGFVCINIHSVTMLTMLRYIMMGTSVFFCIRPLYADAPTGVIPCILGGGAAYLVGTYFYAAGRDGSIPYAHGIWHLFVIAGVCLVRC